MAAMGSPFLVGTGATAQRATRRVTGEVYLPAVPMLDPDHLREAAGVAATRWALVAAGTGLVAGAGARGGGGGGPARPPARGRAGAGRRRPDRRQPHRERDHGVDGAHAEAGLAGAYPR